MKIKESKVNCLNLKYEEGNLTIFEFDKPKVAAIEEIKLKKYNTQNLETLLLQIINKFPNQSIVFPLFKNIDKEYKPNIEILPKLGFKHIITKPIFKKEVQKQNYDYTLTFKTAKQMDSKLIKNIFCKTIIESKELACDYLDTFVPTQAFEQYVLNKDKSEWNIMAFEENNCVGFITIQHRKYRETSFGTINYIAIDPKYRGKGYSTQLLHKAEEEFAKKKIKWWYESTDIKNKAMIGSFKKYGFKEVRQHLGYVYKPEIAFKRFLK